METPVFFQDVWTLYFHDPDDVNWNLNSYIRLGDMSTVQDFWEHHEAIASYLSNGMFFVMREHVFPCWDDPHNIKGGCISIKVLKEDLPAVWEHLIVRMLGERLFSPAADEDCDAWSVVTGLSVSPKRYFCIIKIWLGSQKYTDPRMFRLPETYDGEVLYRANADNIKGNNQVQEYRNVAEPAAAVRKQ